MIDRDRLDHLLRTLFADKTLASFASAVPLTDGPGLVAERLVGGVRLDTEDAATVLRIISGEDFAGTPPKTITFDPARPSGALPNGIPATQGPYRVTHIGRDGGLNIDPIIPQGPYVAAHADYHNLRPTVNAKL